MTLYLEYILLRCMRARVRVYTFAITHSIEDLMLATDFLKIDLVTMYVCKEW